MSNLISRQDAIDYLMTNMAWYDEDGYEESEDEKLDDITDLINGVPSAEPESTMGQLTELSQSTKDCISRQVAIDALQKEINKGIPPFDDVMGSIRCGIRLARNIIEDLPSAQPERKTGRWIPVTNGRGGHQCDRCGCYAPSYQSSTEWLSNFCPNCGADMRGEHDE